MQPIEKICAGRFFVIICLLNLVLSTLPLFAQDDFSGTAFPRFGYDRCRVSEKRIPAVEG